MEHIVINETLECPKCEKEFRGACVQILEMVVCTHCFYEKYEKELAGKIEKAIRDYFSPNNEEGHTTDKKRPL